MMADPHFLPEARDWGWRGPFPSLLQVLDATHVL